MTEDFLSVGLLLIGVGLQHQLAAIALLVALQGG